MTEVIFVVGGCRSGKSRYALQLAEDAPEMRKVYVATCIPRDGEMEDRVARHREERGPHWLTMEAPLDLESTLRVQRQEGQIVLVDCLTMWVSNLLMEDASLEQLRARFQDLADVLGSGAGKVILVSNEVGCGVVPDHVLGRTFRDAVGELNQAVAGASRTVFWTVAGIPVRVK